MQCTCRHVVHVVYGGDGQRGRGHQYCRSKKKERKEKLTASVDMVGQAVGDALLSLHADVV